tara:strand:- start:324 stop:809 length:486 start_codon:yes stop_codon:yes gene_type:complete
MKNRETDEWLKQNERSTRNFIRKWGHFVKHDALLKPIIPPKYDIGFIVKNCTLDLIYALEPWCSTLYTNINPSEYIKIEQPNTLYNLNDRVKMLTQLPWKSDIKVEFDCSKLNNESFKIIQQLPSILQDSGEKFSQFELDIFKFTIGEMKTFEKELVKCER